MENHRHAAVTVAHARERHSLTGTDDETLGQHWVDHQTPNRPWAHTHDPAELDPHRPTCGHRWSEAPAPGEKPDEVLWANRPVVWRVCTLLALHTDPIEHHDTPAEQIAQMARRSLGPDLDKVISYEGFSPSTPRGSCRLRVWLDERLAVVSEIAANQGPSVTNCIEHVAEAAEAEMAAAVSRAALELFRRSLVRPLDPATGARDWVLVEHYDTASYEGGRPGHVTIDRVTFGRRDVDGRYHAPAWQPFPQAASILEVAP